MMKGPRDATGRAGGKDLEPLAVSPRQACFLLGIGNTRLYELIRDRELVTYHEGRARRITMESIHARLARLAAAGERASQRRRPAQPSKHPSDRSLEALLALLPSDPLASRQSSARFPDRAGAVKHGVWDDEI
jgi:excisionase family DNA binding protein